MALEIYWTDFSKRELRSIFDFYSKKANPKIAQKLISNIVSDTIKLNSHQEIGQKEILLEKRPQNFRYLIYKNYKIIYWHNISKNRIEISDIFDTRQNPIKIKRT